MNTSGIDPLDERPSDPAYDRLSAADPAATVDPDSAVIRAKVDSSIGAGDAPVVDLATQRARRRPARWLQVAAAAAGVVAVGGGAFFAGQYTADTPVSAQAPAVGSSAGRTPVAQSGPQTAEGGFAADALAGASSSASRSAAMDMGSFGYGRTVFTSQGLADTTSSAQAWGYDPSATFTAETAVRLAAALGVAGDPVSYYGSWSVGSTDWTAASVNVASDGLTSFSYSDPAIQPWAENSTSSGASAEDAIAALTDVMVELGLDPATFTITTDSQDPYSTMAIAAPNLSDDGNGTWYATVTTDGLSSLNGALAPLVDLGTYDVVSPQAAVERLGDVRFGASPFTAYPASGFARDTAVQPVPEPLNLLPEEFSGSSEDPASVPTLSPAAVPGASIAWPVANVTIIEATLGTSTYYQPDGSVALLPTYTLTGSDGSVWTVLAVADAHLNFAATS